MTNAAIWEPCLDPGPPYEILPRSLWLPIPSYPTLQMEPRQSDKSMIMLKTRYTSYLIDLWWWLPGQRTFIPTGTVTYDITHRVSIGWHRIRDESHPSPRAALDRIPDLLLELML